MTTPQNSSLDFLSAAFIVNLPDPTLAQHAATKAYVDANIEGLNWKDSVRAATTANISIASPGATIDGVTMATNDRLLVKNQTTTTENGLYIWNGAATPATRSLDANTGPELEAAVVLVEEGSTNAGTTWRQTAVTITIGSTAIAWTTFGTAAGAASESAAGIAEIATQGEVDALTDDTRFVTALKLANWVNKKLKFTATFGDGAATSYVHTHNLNTKDVQVYVYEVGGSFREVMCEKQHTGVNSVTTLYAVAPASNSLRVVILG